MEYMNSMRSSWIPSIVEHVWDFNAFIDENSITGELLKTLFGYNGNPSLTEMIGYFGYLIIVYFFFTRSKASNHESENCPISGVITLMQNKQASSPV